MECCSYRKARNAAAVVDDLSGFANACIVDSLCDACALSAFEAIVETSGRDEGKGRAACLDVIAMIRPDLLTFEWESPGHPGEPSYDLYLGWVLESKTPTLLRWLLQHKPPSCALTNKCMTELLADTEYVDGDGCKALPDTRACLDVLAEFMHVPLTKDALLDAASCGNAPFFEWVFENKSPNLWKRQEITDTAFSKGHLSLVRRMIREGVPFLPLDDVVRAPSETKKQFRKRKLFVAIMNMFLISQTTSD